MIKDFQLQTINDIPVEITPIPGINSLQLNYEASIGGANAPEPGADKTSENISSGIVNQGALATLNSVGTDQILNEAITALKIADGAVSAAKTSIAAINSSTGEINANKVGTTQIDTNAVTEAKILASAITEAKIATSAVTEGKINALAVTAAKIAAGAITAEKISAGAVTASKITSYNFIMSAGSFSNNSPSAGRISWSSVKVVYNGTEYTISNSSCLATEKHIYWQLSNPNAFSSSVSLPALGNDDFLVAFNNSGAVIMVWNSTVINGNRITAGSISASQISAHSITANEIAANTITANEIAASTITATKMNVSQLSAISANLGSITSGTVTGALLQTSDSSNTGIKIGTVGSDTGIFVYGQTFKLLDTDGILYGHIGGFGGYYNIATYNNRNMLLDAGSATVHFYSHAAPLNDGGKNLGYYNYRWGNCFTLNLTFENGYYLNKNGNALQLNGLNRLTMDGGTFRRVGFTFKDSAGNNKYIEVLATADPV